ncbi:MAG: bifunctional nicotinamidase/pyrazinamidase [Termitinemataceae bacterium]
MNEQLDTAALLIIDVQNDFCPQGALAVPEGDQIIPVINQWSSLFAAQSRPVIATQDWHPEGHISFASRPIQPGQERGIWPDHCVQGTVGAELHPALNKKPINLILRKGFRTSIDSYSAFFENDRTTPTGLEGYLKYLGIDTLYLCGLATDYCVKYSALDARSLGYQVYILEHGVRGVDYPAGSLAQALTELQAAGVRFIHEDLPS